MFKLRNYTKIYIDHIKIKLKMVTELVPEMDNLHILMQLTACKRFIEFCHRESFKTCNINYSCTVTTLHSKIEKADQKEFTYNVRTAIL